MGEDILSLLEIDICLQKGPPDFPESALDITFRKLSFTPEVLEGRLQFIA